MKVLEYTPPDQESPYSLWFNNLGPTEAAKISVALTRLRNGNISAIKWFRGIGEYVIDWGPGYRIYLAQDGADLIILYGGGTKKHQQRDIDAALTLHDEYKAAKKAQNTNTKAAPKSGTKSR